MSNDYQVKFGDVWKMGKHRLLCGDSTEAAMMKAFLAGHQPTLCVTDPPYGINYKASGSNSLYELKVKNDHIVNWADAFRQAKAPVLYVWFGFKSYDIVAKAINEAGFDVKQMLVWVKNGFSLQRTLYHLQHEQCLVSIKQDTKQKDLWTGDRKQRSVWHIDSVKPSKRIHPTEKPVGVYTIPIINHTKGGDKVIDLFAGSGAIFEACERTKRVGLGVELSPEVCSRILSRMEGLGVPVTIESNIFAPNSSAKRRRSVVPSGTQDF